MTALNSVITNELHPREDVHSNLLLLQLKSPFALLSHLSHIVVVLPLLRFQNNVVKQKTKKRKFSSILEQSIFSLTLPCLSSGVD